MKKGLFLILIFGLVLFGCVGCNNDTIVSSDTSSVANSEDAPTESEYSFQELYDEVKSAAKESFADYKYFDMSYDEESNTITYQFAIDGLAYELLLSESASLDDDWAELKEKYVEMSTTVQNKFKNNGYDVDVVIIVLNDKNYDNVFFGAYNGVEAYDYFASDE